MKKRYPTPLHIGDEIRVVTLSQSLGVVSPADQKRAAQRIRAMGFTVTFGKNTKKTDLFGSCSIEDRLEDWNTALEDPNVKMILAVTGGYNVNQLLDQVDYTRIQKNPKIMSGYSDITALLNAIYARTGLVTYSGPCFSTFGMQKSFSYTREMWLQSLTTRTPHIMCASRSTKNGPYTIQTGRAEGTLLGGSICTLNLLQGTLYMPPLQNSILCIEDDNIVGKFFPMEFERNLVSLLQQTDARKIRAILFGRFEPSARMTRAKLTAIVRALNGYTQIPIVANLDFGHTMPQCTFPIGGIARVIARKQNATIEIRQE